MKSLEESDLKRRIRDLLDQVWADADSELDSPVTSIGLQLYGHGGEVNVLLNTDDDESFQAKAIEHFQSRRWGGLAIPELEEWVVEGEEFEFLRLRRNRHSRGPRSI